MTRNPQALIIGGSVGGLFAAHLLRKIGWDVVVFERATKSLESRGAAIGFTEELIEVLQRIGVQFNYSIGTKVRSFVALDHAGAVSHEVRRHQITGAWAHVYRPLKDILPTGCYRPGMILTRIEQDGQIVTAIFADGSRIDGDLLVGADGIQSTVRQQFSPDVAPRYAGYIAWRGIVEESDILTSDHELFFNHLTFCFPAGEMLLCIPMPADDALDPGGRNRRCCYVWYRPADHEKTLPQLCTDAEGRRHGTSIPPPLIRHEIIHDLKASAASLLAPSVARIVERAKQPLFQAIVDLESPQLVFGRVVLLGDAAFVARPHVVAGVTKAALDAQCLADMLSEAHGDLDAALAHYDRERRTFGTKLVSYARQIGAHLEANSERQTESNDKRPDRQPDAILRDYGAPHLFRSPTN
jgi:2-polyprenyl-6-methoxyphenol hydroxylase-like FAD-dependent oxidoreductase